MMKEKNQAMIIIRVKGQARLRKKREGSSLKGNFSGRIS